jgi:IclR family transcriptional regulator, pca regulon regulatory protein
MMTAVTDEHPERYSSSLRNGLSILRCFSAEQPLLGIADMASELGMSRSTTHRYAATLTELGFLEQNPSRQYRLGAFAANVGLSMLGSMELRQRARPLLEELRVLTGRTVSMAVLDGTQAIYVERLRSSRRGQYAIDPNLGLGSHLPLHCTAVGKVLLAYLSAADERAVIAELKLSRRGPGCITTKTALRSELERVRMQGLGVNDEEFEAGTRAIASPVLDAQAEAVAAVNIAVPTSAFSRSGLVTQLGPLLTETTERISAVVAYA